MWKNKYLFILKPYQLLGRSFKLKELKGNFCRNSSTKGLSRLISTLLSKIEKEIII